MEDWYANWQVPGHDFIVSGFILLGEGKEWLWIMRTVSKECGEEALGAMIDERRRRMKIRGKIIGSVLTTYAFTGNLGSALHAIDNLEAN